MKKTFYQLYYYVPTSHLEKTKKAIFKAGAGKMGNYSNCAWQTKGIGQFKPEPKSNAYIGKVGKISEVIEYKVETICPESEIKSVIKATILMNIQLMGLLFNYGTLSSDTNCNTAG